MSGSNILSLNHFKHIIGIKTFNRCYLANFILELFIIRQTTKVYCLILKESIILSYWMNTNK